MTFWSFGEERRTLQSSRSTVVQIAHHAPPFYPSGLSVHGYPGMSHYWAFLRFQQSLWWSRQWKAGKYIYLFCSSYCWNYSGTKTVQALKNIQMISGICSFLKLQRKSPAFHFHLWFSCSGALASWIWVDWASLMDSCVCVCGIPRSRLRC